MKPIPLLLTAVVLSVGASYALQALLTPPDGGAEEAARLRREIDGLSNDLGALRAENRDLQARLERIGAQAPRSAAPASVRTEVQDVDAAVDRWMRDNRPDLLAAAAAEGEVEEAVGEATRRQRALELLARFEDPDLSDSDWEEIWKEIHEAGLMDEALAILEARAAAAPNDPDAQVALANGYFGKLLNTQNQIEVGQWAMKSDAALDRALEIDPQHWDARFQKAVGLSFWPPVMGKQGEAIRHFEILLSQQQRLPANSQYAQTYLYLGNMHQQMGNHAKAKEVWGQGLSSYPDNAQLAAQIENAVND